MSTVKAENTKASPYDDIAPGVKIAAQMSPEPSEIELKFVQQMGVKYAVLWTNAAKSSAEYYASRKALFAEHDISVFGFGNHDVHNQPPLVLGGPNQRAKIEEYKRHIQALGKAGIGYTTYAHMPNGIWSTEREETRGGASARAFDQSKGGKGHWGKELFEGDLTNDRPYSEEEIWDNYTTFIREAARVAEDEGVLIGIHPADPPIAWMGGVRRLFSSIDDYKKAFEIADSPNVGICLCLGCWLEGGELMGASPVEAIRYFASVKKLFKVHFRNVHHPLPYFVETFLDDGYQDMYELMAALQEVRFKGVAIADHIPTMGDDPRLGTAFSIGYMKALLERAQATVK